MFKTDIVCPRCKVQFTPYGTYMLEKCYCPKCRNTFYVLKYAKAIQLIYCGVIFTAILGTYNMLLPKNSVTAAVFWICTMLAVKLITQTTHMILLLIYNLVFMSLTYRDIK